MNPENRIPRYIHFIALACASIIAAIAFALPSEQAEDNIQLSELSTLPTEISLALPTLQAARLSGSSSTDSNTEPDWHTVTVRSGDTLSSIFNRLNISSATLHALLTSETGAEQLHRISPGQQFKVGLDHQGELIALVRETPGLPKLYITRIGDRFQTEATHYQVERRLQFGNGTINRSFYQAAFDAGLSERTIMKLVEIFGWDIDFALDIRPGDRFTVVYEQDYLDGEPSGNEQILAAEFINNNTVYRAVRFTHADGSTHYYRPEGRAMRQAFLRTPVDFRRISSHFQPNRFHPVLGRKRPHMGTDYAAATGTPIRASGDGTIKFLGRKGGYGNTVIIQHRGPYSTLYAHMSRFNRSFKRGGTVRQGDIIGYVGQSGLATGPHLHYEFRINGKQVNPVTVKLPGALPIEANLRDAFFQQTRPLVAKLDLFNRTTRIASATID